MVQVYYMVTMYMIPFSMHPYVYHKTSYKLFYLCLLNAIQG